LENLSFVLGDCFSQRLEGGVDLLTEWLVDNLSCTDESVEKLRFAEAEREVVFDRSDFVELMEL